MQGSIFSVWSWYNRTFFGFFRVLKSEKCSLVPTYPGSESDERLRCGEGEEGIYGCGGMRPRGVRRVCTCGTHHDRSNDILLEGI
jgi:hypothetical protein